MEPSRQQAVRSDQNGWGATLRRALRSTHITETDTDQTTLLGRLNEHRNSCVTGEGKPPREVTMAVSAMIARSLRPEMAGANFWL